MSNYKWVQMSEGCVELRKEDFSSISFLEVNLNSMNPLLLDKLDDNGVDAFIEGDGVFETPRYVLKAIDRKFVTITVPLYEYDLDSGEFVLISESYTDEATDPAEYEWVKETYYRCVEEVTSEQARIFEEQFMENSLDGISSFVTISSDPYQEPNYFYEQYIPEEYMKVCERNCPFTRVKHEVVFIKKWMLRDKQLLLKFTIYIKGLLSVKVARILKELPR